MSESKPLIKWIQLDPPEKLRRYHFTKDSVIEFENVVRVEIRPSGKHRIETAEGRKAFVASGWLWMEIETDEWTC